MVQTLSGHQLCATLPYFATGTELALIVEAKLGIPHNQQLLVCRRRKVDFERTLVEQNITSGSIIVIQIGIKGGSGKTMNSLICV